MKRNRLVVWVALTVSCRPESQPLPASWEMTPPVIQELVEDAMARQPQDVIALDAAYRWQAMQGHVTQAVDIGWRLYAVSAYPDGHIGLFQELLALGPVPELALNHICGSYSVRGFLRDAAQVAHPQFLEWIEREPCRQVSDRNDLVLRWVEMVRLHGARAQERDYGFAWLERHLPPADRARIRLAWLLRDAGHYDRCRQSLATLIRIMPHDHEVAQAMDRCRA